MDNANVATYLEALQSKKELPGVSAKVSVVGGGETGVDYYDDTIIKIFINKKEEGSPVIFVPDGISSTTANVTATTNATTSTSSD
ncbi:UNVERIFIED_CONTAM: hypothetical protein HDU68_007320 [Siphonaria sp. JEL0065]|nr:hypothetical protein HDU68_007320 [Siphonaria sp. JEL0065]